MTTRLNDPGSPGLARTLQALHRRFGPAGLIRPAAETGPPPPVIPTGFPTLDEALGLGGLPRGRLVDVFGPPGSGKTTLCLQTIAALQRQGGQALYIDAENSFDLAYARRLGVDVDRLLIAQPDTAEEALDIALTMVEAGLALVVIDSVAALTPRAEVAGDIGLNHGSLLPALLSQAARKLVGPLRRHHSLLLLTNQIRIRPDALFGRRETGTGGQALRHYAAVRLELRPVQALKARGAVVGSIIRATVRKNKLAPPFRQAEFEIRAGGTE